jgi:hypothetical protein
LRRTLARRRPRSDLQLNLAVIVDVLGHLGKVAHVEPLFADRAFLKMVSLSLSNTVRVDGYGAGS